MDERQEINSEMDSLESTIKAGHSKVEGVNIQENKQIDEKLKEIIESSGANPVEYIKIEDPKDIVMEHMLNLESESVVDEASKTLHEALVKQRLKDGHKKAEKVDKKELADGRRKHEAKMQENLQNSPLDKETVAELESNMYDDAKNLFGVEV